MGHRTFIAFALSLVLSFSAQAAPSDGPSTARAWLGLVDRAAYSESWTASSPMLKGRVSVSQFTEVFKPLRKPLGAVMSRTLSGEQNTKSLPAVPDGNYKILTFTTQFSAKKDAIETVILSKENGNWKVAGYFIR